MKRLLALLCAVVALAALVVVPTASAGDLTCAHLVNAIQHAGAPAFDNNSMIARCSVGPDA